MPLNTNDPVVLTIAFVLGAVFNSGVGLLSAEIRARQDERRTIERERRAEAARDRREGDDLVRASRLRAIEETQRYCEHLFASMHAQISGDTERMREQHQELSRLPKADLSLLGDAELYRAVSEFGLAMDKLEGPVDVLAGNRLLHTLASIQARVNTAFRLQEEATLRGEAPKRTGGRRRRRVLRGVGWRAARTRRLGLEHQAQPLQLRGHLGIGVYFVDAAGRPPAHRTQTRE